MLRCLRDHDQKSADATYKANAACVTGMAVIKDFANKLAKFPTAATGDNLFFVQKERYATGINAAYTDLSDYDTIYTNVAQGEFVVLYSFDYDEVFATDAFTGSTLVDADIGKTVVANTSGLLTPATSTATSKYLFEGWYMDNGHKLAKIRVLDTPVANS